MRLQEGWNNPSRGLNNPRNIGEIIMADPLKQLPNAMADTFSSMASSLGDAMASFTGGIRGLADGGIQAITKALPRPPTGAGQGIGAQAIPNPIQMANQAVSSFITPVTGAANSLATAMAGSKSESADGKEKQYMSF